MRRSWLVLIVGGVLVLGVVAASAVASALFVLNVQTSAADRCDQPVGTCSVELTAEQIEELSSVELPEGSQVLESEHQSALDWMMTATVLLSAGSAAPVLDPDLPWDGSTLAPDGIVREVTTTVQYDGRIVLRISAFTT